MSILSKTVPYFRGYYQFTGTKITPAQVIEQIDKCGNHKVLDVCRTMMMREDLRKAGKFSGRLLIPDIACIFPFKNMLLGMWGREADEFKNFIDEAL